ncbi:MAG TPA: hypothetical protein VGJ22_08080 [Anaerolineales bacterium]|jgi:hypothetical protein
MREWSLGPGDPLYLTIAADARLSAPDYFNDHIWELEIGSGEPQAVSLRTTYGLRARSMRLFLRFAENGQTVSDPAAFASPPRVRRFYPNFLSLEFAPFENLTAISEYWIPESSAAAGRVILTNHGTATRMITLEVAGGLAPLEGQSLTPVQQQLVNVLAGQTGGLFPVVFMTGGPKPGPGPHPALTLDLELGPGQTRQFTYAQAAKDTLKASFELARHTAARPWEAERARIELVDAAQTIDIQTGDPDWDAALGFSQRAALGLFFNGNQNLPNASYVWARQPDQGFSRKGDASDYPPAWTGQTPLETYYLASLLPAATDLGKGLLKNFLSTQGADGDIDHKPGLGGQRGKMLATPMLAVLAWKLHEAAQDDSFLAEVYPGLSDFFQAWLSPSHDVDQDGLPQWDHLLQTGFEDNPLFDVWHPWSQGVDISFVHTPELAALLSREADSLAQMADALNKADEAEALRAQAELLRSTLEPSWNERAALYIYRDRDTGLSPAGKVLVQGSGSGILRVKAEFKQPVRVQVEVLTQNPAAKRPEIEIGEYVTKGEAEIITGPQFQWRSGGLVATSRHVYKRVARVKVKGVDADDQVVVRTVDLTAQDHTLLLPLWAQAPSDARALAMLKHAILDTKRFDRPFGTPAVPLLSDLEAESVAMGVHLPWNHLIGEGLLEYGLRTEAAALLARMMKAVIHSLKQTRAFYQRYHAQRGMGIGERNALNGFAPVGLFLQTLGVRIYNARRVRLEGRNPFPWPVTLKHKGLTVQRGLHETIVIFPNGEAVTIASTEAVIVSE